MHRSLNLYEAKTLLSALVEEAAAGAEIIIAKKSADFDAPLPKALLDRFHGTSSVK